MKVWVAERVSDGPPDGPPLVVLPGATLNMIVMGVGLERLLTAMPKRRVVIIEHPHHGRNISLDLDFSNQVDSISSMAEYVESIRNALGIEIPFDLLGYSLGGGVSAQYAITYPKQVHRLLLLTPYFYETLSDAFTKQFDARKWRSIHGWESFDEMKQFFHNWLGLHPSDAPPHLVMRGLHALRSDEYPTGYWSAFFDAVSKTRKESDTFLSDRRSDIAQFGRPTLVITAEQDSICDAQKLTCLTEKFGSNVCTLISVESGHFFFFFFATICEISSARLLDFLSKKPS